MKPHPPSAPAARALSPAFPRLLSAPDRLQIRVQPASPSTARVAARPIFPDAASASRFRPLSTWTSPAAESAGVPPDRRCAPPAAQSVSYGRKCESAPALLPESSAGAGENLSSVCVAGPYLEQPAGRYRKWTGIPPSVAPDPALRREGFARTYFTSDATIRESDWNFL